MYIENIFQFDEIRKNGKSFGYFDELITFYFNRK